MKKLSTQAFENAICTICALFAFLPKQKEIQENKESQNLFIGTLFLLMMFLSLGILNKYSENKKLEK